MAMPISLALVGLSVSYFFDTLLDHLSHDEIEAVLAHELGHFHHQHIRQRLWGSIIFSLLLFAVLGVLADTSAFLPTIGSQYGFSCCCVISLQPITTATVVPTDTAF